MLTFDTALKALKNGRKAMRWCWMPGKSFIFAIGDSTWYSADHSALAKTPFAQPVFDREREIVFCSEKGWLSAWRPSGADLLADDWIIITD